MMMEITHCTLQYPKDSDEDRKKECERLLVMFCFGLIEVKTNLDSWNQNTKVGRHM